MFRSFASMLVLFVLTFGAATLIIAQESETGQPVEGEPGNQAAVGTVDSLEGEISRKKQDGEGFETLAPVGEEKTPKAVVVADALWCRQCKPQPEPIEMPELY